MHLRFYSTAFYSILMACEHLTRYVNSNEQKVPMGLDAGEVTFIPRLSDCHS